MADSPSQSPTDQAAAAHAYASNGLQVLQAATNAHQAVLQGEQGTQDHDTTVGGHQQRPETPTHGQTPNQQPINIAPNPLPSPGQVTVSDPAALAAVAAAAGAQDALQMGAGAVGTGVLTLGQGPPMSGPPMSGPPMSGPLVVHGRPIRDPTHNPKLSRLSRACDNCSARKVKCEQHRPCKPCIDLNLECTNDRLVKRRGPPNKAVEAIRNKKQRISDASTSSLVSQIGNSPSPFASNPHTAAQALVSIAGNEGSVRLDAEAIAPMPILEALVDDFFTYIHPLCPFPHQPTFQTSFVNREDRTNPEFLALLASMIGALVASFPRSARAHLKEQQTGHMFPRAVVMIEKCRDITLDARGSRWAAKQPKTLDDAATSYFLALAAGYTLQWNTFRHFMTEALSLISELGFHKPKHAGETPTFGNDNCSPDRLPFNHIKDQVGKRIFWCIFLAVRSLYQLGAYHGSLVILPEIPDQPYPDAPANADDKEIQANEVMEQDDSVITLTTGFRMVKDIYMTMNGVVSAAVSMGLEYHPWSEQRRVMKDGLLAVKSVIDRLPLELQLASPDQHDGNGLSILDSQNLEYLPPAYPHAQAPQDVRHIIKTQPHVRRLLQYEIQKANIYVSWLATRSYFVELYFTRRNNPSTGYDPAIHMLTNGGGGSDEENAELREEEDVRVMMLQEREQIVDDLLRVLGTIQQRNLEPNGGSLISKIRQVASTLLESTPGREGLSVRHKEALTVLLGVLTRLEKTGTPGAVGNDPMTAQDEEEELNNWASLRDYQMRFAAHGGYAGNI